MRSILAYLQQHEARNVEELLTLLRFPTISADPRHEMDMLACAQYLRDWLAARGFSAELLPTGGHPAVYAEWLAAPGAPTVLSYGHYDVQPVDPLELWNSPPFSPMIRDGCVYARGADDDKGQFLTHLLAAQAHLEVRGRLPVNLKIILEGEEEIGSVHLPETLQKNRDKLAADVAVISDSGQLAAGRPTLCYGLRGLLYFQVKVSGPSHDLHSGEYGGAVANPVNVLCGMIGRLQDADGRITIPGFYDRVRPMEAWERELLDRLGYGPEEVRRLTGVPELPAGGRRHPAEATWFLPSLDCNGIVGGYTGAGAKTVLPAEASAKISMRLVPDQDPKEISAAFVAWLKELAPPSVRLELQQLSCAGPILVPSQGRWMEAARAALKMTFNRDPLLVRMGGSIPIVLDIAETLGLESLLLGWGLPDDCLHAPNEKFDLAQFHAGTRAMAQLYDQLATA